jgi:hypothetical protein
MRAILFLVFLTAGWPLARAWLANRRTALIQAIHWAWATWLAWLLTIALGETPANQTGVEPARYLALSLTGCAGVAVLGARRPQVGAWNFVVLGLLAVHVLPLAEQILANKDSFGTLRFAFLGATVTVGILNYLPTRLAPAVLLLALACAGEIVVLCAPEVGQVRLAAIDLFAQICLVLTPWAAWGSWRRRTVADNLFDRLWLHFRNRFGLVWGQRVREQFNHSARNNGWPVWLSWQGLRRVGLVTDPDLITQQDLLETLKGLLRRFEEEPRIEDRGWRMEDRG